ncbi:hypothetical protein TRFO_26839 [Tritrichomonas foetus]|uniref:Uncharacterized protein n=1 Tax=Tritrichomonas foetus TaxID=1144522 RepID=A0A1J4K207_9EUKA|nr:hypothetical protein TRFO_26839 [Tritrichomonas foetus]|eukprot:OHT05423.1 hypothetical protein TRFO_26839 [Tritrichomonas foetus]
MRKARKHDDLFTIVDSSIHSTNHLIDTNSATQEKNVKISETEIPQILENIKNAEIAEESLFTLSKMSIKQIGSIVQQNPSLVQLLLSYISPNTLNLILPSLNIIYKCCCIPDFPPFLLNFVSLHHFTELAFSNFPDEILRIVCKIYSQLIKANGSSAEEEIIFFLNNADQIENGYIKASALRNILIYLNTVSEIPILFSQMNLIERLNANLLNLHYSQQLIMTLKIIEHCIHEKGVSFTCFNVEQIIRLMKTENILDVQIWTTKIMNIILLNDSIENFPFKAQLCNSLHWIILKGAFASKLQAIFCLRTLIGLYSDHFPQLELLLDPEFFQSIFGLLSSGNDGVVTALSFLMCLIQVTSHPEIVRSTLSSLQENEIREEIEELSMHEEDIISTHAIELLKRIDSNCMF